MTDSKRAHKLETCRSHAVRAQSASRVLAAYLTHPDHVHMTADDAAMLMDAAKILEASGCYIRRAVKSMTETQV